MTSRPAPGPGDLTRWRPCHRCGDTYPDADGRCACDAYQCVEDGCDGLPATLRGNLCALHQAAHDRRQATRRRLIGSDRRLLVRLAEDIRSGEYLSALVALGEYAEVRASGIHDFDVFRWRRVADACWDRLADEGEREAAGFAMSGGAR